MIKEQKNDINLNEIAKTLSRYTFENRLSFIQYLSFRSVNFIRDFKRKTQKSLPNTEPWDVETIATIALYFEKVSKIRRFFRQTNLTTI